MTNVFRKRLIVIHHDPAAEDTYSYEMEITKIN